MSWIDLENTEYVVTTGDDKVFTPYWFKAKRRWDFCIAKFEFYDVAGSLVKRGEPKGVEYVLDILFQGEDHLDVAEEFRKSSADKRAWTIKHPHYGSLYVQPISLEQDNTDGNVSRFTGTVIETLLDSGVAVENNTTDAVVSSAQQTRVTLNERLEADLVTPPSTTFLTRLRTNMAACKTFLLTKIAAVQDNVDAVNNYYATANSLINQSVFDTADVAAACSNLIVVPASFTDSVANRLTQLQGLADIFRADVARILALVATPEELLQLKLQYENNMGLVITAICETVVTNVEDDYLYRVQVLDTVTSVVTLYNDYLSDLCSLQALNGGLLHAYVPAANALTEMHTLVYNAVHYLFAEALNAKQQRVHVLPYDSNVLLEANNLYPDDGDIEAATLRLMANNGIGHNEILRLMKGRKLIYYV